MRPLMTESRSFRICAKWDDEAKVWVATSEDVPGLITEARSMDTLVQKLETLIPELLELNGALDDLDPSNIPFELHSQLQGKTRVNAG